jgi:hypothetical protein
VDTSAALLAGSAMAAAPALAQINVYNNMNSDNGSVLGSTAPGQIKQVKHNGQKYAFTTNTPEIHFYFTKENKGETCQLFTGKDYLRAGNTNLEIENQTTNGDSQILQTTISGKGTVLKMGTPFQSGHCWVTQ